jgi:hypothetical protein
MSRPIGTRPSVAVGGPIVGAVINGSTCDFDAARRAPTLNTVQQHLNEQRRYGSHGPSFCAPRNGLSAVDRVARDENSRHGAAIVKEAILQAKRDVSTKALDQKPFQTSKQIADPAETQELFSGGRALLGCPPMPSLFQINFLERRLVIRRMNAARKLPGLVG